MESNMEAQHSSLLISTTGQVPLGSIEVTIGRAHTNQVALSERRVSRHHAKISPEGQGHTITDLGSSNGTFVNHQKLHPFTPHRLNPGDWILIGNILFMYHTIDTIYLLQDTDDPFVPKWRDIASFSWNGTRWEPHYLTDEPVNISLKKWFTEGIIMPRWLEKENRGVLVTFHPDCPEFLGLMVDQLGVLTHRIIPAEKSQITDAQPVWPLASS